MEAAALLPAGGVWAVEADAGRADLIRENRRRTGACLVEVVHGRAPGSLRGLPDPDKIFVGGGLSRGDELMEAAWSRLKPGGRLTAHLALLSGLERVRGFFAHRGVPVELDMVQAARGAELAGDLRLAALNPVFILTAAKPGEAP
jgi:precorrin-6Y C5,15-methyltransferase (decarboxylating)